MAAAGGEEAAAVVVVVVVSQSLGRGYLDVDPGHRRYFTAVSTATTLSLC